MRKCEPQIRTFFEIARSYDDQAASSCLWNDLHPKLSIRTRPEPTVDRATLASLPRRSLTERAIEECWSCGVAIQRLTKLKSKLRSDRTYFQPHPLSTSGRLPSHLVGDCPVIGLENLNMAVLLNYCTDRSQPYP